MHLLTGGNKKSLPAARFQSQGSWQSPPQNLNRELIRLQCPEYIEQITVQSVECTVYSLQSTVYRVYNTMYNV